MIGPFIVVVMGLTEGAFLAVPLLLIVRAIRSELSGNDRPQLPD